MYFIIVIIIISYGLKIALGKVVFFFLIYAEEAHDS